MHLCPFYLPGWNVFLITTIKAMQDPMPCSLFSKNSANDMNLKKRLNKTKWKRARFWRNFFANITYISDQLPWWSLVPLGKVISLTKTWLSWLSIFCFRHKLFYMEYHCNVRRIAAYFCLRAVLTRRFPLIGVIARPRFSAAKGCHSIRLFLKRTQGPRSTRLLSIIFVEHVLWATFCWLRFVGLCE